MTRTAEVLTMLAYLGLLLLFTARPAWFDRLTAEAKRRAQQIKGTLSL